MRKSCTGIRNIETPVTFAPAENDRPGVDHGSAIDPTTLRLVGHDGVAVDRLAMAEGTFEVRQDGRVRFTPANGFTGAVPAVEYRVLDSAGAPGSATIHVTVEREALAFTGAEVGTVAASGIALLLSGLVLLLLRARRRRDGNDTV
jgi:CshA-type fibril repeat protein